MQTTERGEKMRQPEEIKMGLEFDIGCCSNCYECSSVDNPYGCKDRANQIAVAEDALEYIRQLEAQVGKDTDVPRKKRICPTTGLECCECKPGGPCAKEG